MEDLTTTWWLWNASVEDRGKRVVLQVRTLRAGTLEVHTPVAYFAECDSGMGVSEWWANRIMLEPEEFARLMVAGDIRPLDKAAQIVSAA